MTIVASVGSVASTVAGDVGSVARTHGYWMTWNLLLALVPLGLGLLLFRTSLRRTGAWWFGVVVWVLFLPNSPYVLTDVVHLFDDIRGARSDLQVLGLYLPLYLVFFALGLGLYVSALEVARRYVRTEAPKLDWFPIEVGLHLLCAVGIYLGRVVRLNSWEVFTRPHAVLGAVDRVPGLFGVTVVLITFVVLCVGTLLTRVFVHGSFHLARTWRAPSPS